MAYMYGIRTPDLLHSERTLYTIQT